MKNIKDKAAIKQARKALKKQIKEKLVIQIETLVSEFGPDVSKAKKAIDKAAKNLAKILAAKLRPEAHAAPAEPKAKKGKKATDAAPITPAKAPASKTTKDTEPEKAI
ncbi:hypothetical protein [Mucilaginibacter gossypii]|uniref:Uncharacterized protein n=1 Tax=Mucilaginibacter gossypii TaxID=551996 RepID=A0A1G7MRU6_9SPHI|nr:hypothetical protein [Mucilaginibacter gossypii]SDF64376.1 hypothetical protein SAMN05192573_10126 [Mucilaginibacter gossypii]